MQVQVAEIPLCCVKEGNSEQAGYKEPLKVLSRREQCSLLEHVLTHSRAAALILALSSSAQLL